MCPVTGASSSREEEEKVMQEHSFPSKNSHTINLPPSKTHLDTSSVPVITDCLRHSSLSFSLKERKKSGHCDKVTVKQVKKKNSWMQRSMVNRSKEKWWWDKVPVASNYRLDGNRFVFVHSQSVNWHFQTHSSTYVNCHLRKENGLSAVKLLPTANWFGRLHLFSLIIGPQPLFSKVRLLLYKKVQKSQTNELHG